MNIYKFFLQDEANRNQSDSQDPRGIDRHSQVPPGNGERTSWNSEEII